MMSRDEMFGASARAREPIRGVPAGRWCLHGEIFENSSDTDAALKIAGSCSLPTWINRAVLPAETTSSAMTFFPRFPFLLLLLVHHRQESPGEGQSFHMLKSRRTCHISAPSSAFLQAKPRGTF